MAFEQQPLGKTGLKTARLGIGVGYHINGKSMAWAIENGINYIFWGSIKFRTVPKALKLLGKNRDKAIIAVPCYGHKFIPLSRWVTFTVNSALKALKRDYLDIFQLAYIPKIPSDSLIEAMLKLKEQGKVRHLGITTHNRKLATELFKNKDFEIFNIRYNAANRGAEKEVYPYVDNQVIVNYNSTRWGQLLKSIAGWPENKPVPKAIDCYRFVLSRPEVRLCLMGVSNLRQLRGNVKALEKGPMSEEELQWMREFGDMVYNKKKHFMDSKKISPAKPE
ncbi:MAG: aldo/keto reductase [Actinobacteria bacterium]|nr:MAG: aldo/keto reductase [Actinomycetota bacterium]